MAIQQEGYLLVIVSWWCLFTFELWIFFSRLLFDWDLKQ